MSKHILFAAEYANLPLIPPSLQPEADFSYGANFASGGAGVLNWTNSNFNMINFMEQVGQFKDMARRLNATLGPTKTREILGQAVYLFSIGGNDYIYYFIDFYSEGQSSTQSDQEQFVKAIVGNTTNGLIELYGLGARKIAFQNVGPMGCLPLFEMDYPEYNGSCIPVLLSMPILHNKELYETLTDLAERLEGFKFSVMDYLPSLYDRMMNPSKYGFEIGRAPCYGKDCKDYQGPRGYGSGNYNLCEYPSAYVFFDAAHTTQRANEQLAKLLWDGDPSVTRPYTVKQLFEED
ncbi:GDSL esterase/lipase 4-like [Punica granatum]|uniref:GDSL esterase/lipase 4-like n=1 Tax=Punica granatum TaxID=22663 RepID=A0A6P8E7J7_PUNGR|nr:GDSL esterase/lipase 4-like [Punica granatum]